MALAPIELSSITQLYDFVESCGVPTGLILDHHAPHRPWARSVSSSCFELKWFHPQSPLSPPLLRHLSNFAHQSLRDTAILLIRNGQVYRTIDVDQLHGRSEPHRLSSFVQQIWNVDSRQQTGRSQTRAAIDSDDPFSVLGCLPSDSPKTIQKRYRELVLQYHPDRVSHLGPELRDLAAEKTKALNLAFQAIRKKLGF